MIIKRKTEHSCALGCSVEIAKAEELCGVAVQLKWCFLRLLLLLAAAFRCGQHLSNRFLALKEFD